MARVSIVVSHYDRQSLLLEALGSIAAQTYRDFEVIVVNDHGADSGAQVEEFAARASTPGRPLLVRYDHRPANRGVAATRNRGVALARGELIAYLDDDDLWHPRLLEHLAGALDANSGCGLVYADAEIWRMERNAPDSAPAEGGAGGWRCAAKRTLEVPFDLDELRRDDFIVPSGMMHRRSLYDAVGPFDESLYVSDDWDWLLRAAAITRIERVPRVAVTVRIWADGGNLSADFGVRRRAALAEIERRHATLPIEPKTFWEVAATSTSPSPAKLLELATADQRSKLLFALVRFGVPTMLAGGTRSLAGLAAELGMDGLAAHRFLHACAELGLLVREGEGFRNAPDTQRFLVRGAPKYLGGVLDRYARASTSKAWDRLEERLRSWRPGGNPGRLAKEGTPGDDEILGQHRLSLAVGEALARALDLSRHRRMLDLGGGTGAMSIALCQRYPALEAIVFERPPVAAGARVRVKESGIDRIEVREGDFLAEPLAEGCDVVLLANLSSMFDTADNRALLTRIFEYLPPGGRVVLSGWMLDDEGSGPLLPILFCLEDIVLGAPDVERSTAQYAGWLARAGFEEIERAMYFEPTSYVAGRKPDRASTEGGTLPRRTG